MPSAPHVMANYSGAYDNWGVAVAGTILGGMPEVTFCILVATAIYALYRLLRRAADGPAN